MLNERSSIVWAWRAAVTAVLVGLLLWGDLGRGLRELLVVGLGTGTFIVIVDVRRSLGKRRGIGNLAAHVQRRTRHHGGFGAAWRPTQEVPNAVHTQTRERRSAAAKADPRRRWVLAIGIVVLALVVGIVIVVNVSDEGALPEAGPALELSFGESSALASCLQFDVAILADMPVAFEGTATSVEDSAVTMSVDRWFRGGDADTVRLLAEHQSPALIAGFEMQPGEKYLIAATNGTVNYCGYSGPATPELLAGYEAAFAG